MVEIPDACRGPLLRRVDIVSELKTSDILLRHKHDAVTETYAPRGLSNDGLNTDVICEFRICRGVVRGWHTGPVPLPPPSPSFLA